MKINYFQPLPTNLEELKTKYRELAKKYHPDINPTGLEAMKTINNEYDHLFNTLPKTKQEQTETASEYKDIINAIINLNVTIEIIGSWVWVTGNTYAVKNILKDTGFKWAANKKAWYWHPGEYNKKWKQHYSMEDIKRMHYAQTIKTAKDLEKIS